MSYTYELSSIPSLDDPRPEVTRGVSGTHQQARLDLADAMVRRGIDRSPALVLASIVESTWTDDPEHNVTARIVAQR